MAFKSDKQRKAFFAKINPLPRGLINPFFIPKGSKFVVTKSKGAKAFVGKSKFFKNKDRAIKESRKTKTSVFKIPKTLRVFSARKEFKIIRIRK